VPREGKTLLDRELIWFFWFLDMEIDGQPNASKPTTADDTSTRVQKRGRNKSRSKMTFKPHPGKLKRMAAKKK
jgi:hypothetical protein